MGLPTEDTLARWGSDDMFYYTQIAGNFFNNGIMSFDGINPGSGVQPLFFLLLAPFGNLLINNIEGSIFTLFLLITTLNIATAFLIKNGVSKITENSLYGVIAASVFIIHPKIISVCYQGTEGALSILMLVAVFIVWNQWLLNKKHFVFSSFVLGLVVLTRLDFAFLLFGMGIISIYQKRLSLINLLKVGITPVIFTGLWLFFIYIQTGSYQPDSGVAKQLHISYLFQDIGYERLITSLKNFVRTLDIIFRAEQTLSFTTFITISIGIIGLVKYWKTININKFKKIGLPMLGGSILNISVLIIILCFYREWYIMPFFLLFILAYSALIVVVFNRLKVTRFIFPFLLLVSIFWWTEANYSSRMYLHSTDHEMMQWAKKNIPKESKIGAFNSGFYGSYLGKEYEVINLDGVVNHNAVESFKSNNLKTYIWDQKIDYIIDRTSSIKFYSDMSGDGLIESLTLVKEWESPESRKFGVYKLNR